MGARQDAVDLMFGQFATEWAASSLSPVPEIAWQDVPYDPPEDCASWARVSLKHSDSDIVTLGGTGNRVWRTEGRLWVQCFTKLGGGRRSNDEMVEVVIDAFRGIALGVTSPRVRMYDVKPQEVGPDGPWFQQSVSVFFQYDEIV